MGERGCDGGLGEEGERGAPFACPCMRKRTVLETSFVRCL